MEIQPRTNIKLLRNVPLDNTYEHTLYFGNVSDQTTYFASMTKYELQNNSYQRVNKGVMRIAKCADDIYDCNYLMFQNTAFGEKWFYAFIKTIEYVNNETSEIEYEMDDMQTWFFEFDIDRCFVKREHSYNDSLFGNLIAEDLEIGDYEVVQSYTYDMNEQGVTVLATKKYEDVTQPPSGTTISNVYSPLEIVSSNTNTAQSGRLLTDPYISAGQEDAIVAMYQYPERFGSAGIHYEDFSINRLDEVGGGYVPRNKKLYSYPYSVCVLTDLQGNDAELRWEQWDESHVGDCEVAGCSFVNPTALCYPTNYRGRGKDWESGVTHTGFASVPFGGDSFKAFWAQNKNSTTMGVLSQMGTMLLSAGLVTTGVVSGGTAIPFVLGAVASGASAARSVAKVKDAERIPPQAHGQFQSEYLSTAMRNHVFQLQQVAIREPFAKVIDDYFDKYGYATNRVKTPNTHSRPHWNYVQTIGCTITGSIPADSAKKICTIFDAGVTFWKHGNEVGNYSLDNRPT